MLPFQLQRTKTHVCTMCLRCCPLNFSEQLALPFPAYYGSHDEASKQWAAGVKRDEMIVGDEEWLSHPSFDRARGVGQSISTAESPAASAGSGPSLNHLEWGEKRDFSRVDGDSTEEGSETSLLVPSVSKD